MIGKIATGKSFQGCMKYLHEGRLQENEELQKMEMAKKQAEVIYYNQCFGNKKELNPAICRGRCAEPEGQQACLSYIHQPRPSGCPPVRPTG